MLAMLAPIEMRKFHIHNWQEPEELLYSFSLPVPGLSELFLKILHTICLISVLLSTVPYNR